MLRNIFNNSIKLSVVLTSFWLGTASYSIIHRELLNKKLLNSYITLKEITISGLLGSMSGLYICNRVLQENKPLLICNINITSY